MLISILRTFIPYAWGIIIGAVLSAVPVLEPLRDQLLAYGDLAVPVIAAILAGLWYAFWRWLEPKIPAWIVRLVLGSAKMPIYEPLSVIEDHKFVIDVEGESTVDTDVVQTAVRKALDEALGNRQTE